MHIKHILIAFGFICISLNDSVAQSYTPLPDSNATWNLDLISIFCPPFGYCSSTSFSIIKDTTIGNFTYHLTNHPNAGTGSGFIPAYRQDIPNKKIYFPFEISSGSGIYLDTLLFDFSMQIGDSILDMIANTPYYYKVLGIDSIYNGSQYLKRFYMGDNSAPTTMIIEGVGNTSGLFGFFFFFETSYQLVCMNKNNQSFFPSDTTSCITIGVNEFIPTSGISIFPNIVNSDLRININYNGINHKIKTIKILDISGIQKAIIESVTDNFSIVNLKSGIYFVIIETEKGVKSAQKLIVL